MRLTLKTNLAMRVLMFCAVHRERIVRKHDIAEACNASEAHLAVIIHQLGQAGLIETHRGRSGGVKLARSPEAIVVSDVFREFENNYAFAECFDGETNTCPIAASCRLKPLLCKALHAFYSVLEGATLAELIDGNCALAHVFELEAEPA
ncbi:MAG: Rrf2 family transcriptional regulator [Hyphomicrobiaceae bacterium]|nr:Rrf2 family transcriptional regulator [Hyphomicrobiaceae bacterium]